MFYLHQLPSLDDESGCIIKAPKDSSGIKNFKDVEKALSWVFWKGLSGFSVRKPVKDTTEGFWRKTL